MKRESLICAKRACARAHSNLRAITCAPYTLMCALFKIARAKNFLYPTLLVWTSLKIYTHRSLMRIIFSYDILSRAHIRLNNLLITLCYGLQPHSYFAPKKRKVGCHRMGNLSFHLSVENDGGWQLKIWVYEDSESQGFRKILEILRDSARFCEILRDSARFWIKFSPKFR